MNKGIVVEINNKSAIVMKKTGEMIKIKAKEKLEVGDKIYFFDEDIINKKKQNFSKTIIPILTVAALLMVVLLCNLPIQMNKSYAIVTLDINPSIELAVDKEGKIIEVRGINADAVALSLDKIEGMNLKDGMKEIKDSLSKEGYLKDKNNNILIGFAFLEDEDIEFEDIIQNDIKTVFNNMTIAYLKGNREDLNMANDQGISLGRYEADLEIDDLMEDSIENLSVEELVRLLEECKDIEFLDEEIMEEIEEELEDRVEDDDDLDD